ncbi:thioredoxin family protein [Candidatus Dependentiae bacterium]|nr:thioredoxin family protein [Candidatus Dependentiae bacterium]
MHSTKQIPYILLLLNCVSLHAYQVESNIKKIDANTQEISFTLKLDPQEALYKDSFMVQADNRDVTLSPVSVSTQPLSFFDKQYDTTKEGYKDSVTFTTTAHKNSNAHSDKTQLHAFFTLNTQKNAQEYTKELSFENGNPTQALKSKNTAQTADRSTQELPGYTTATNPVCAVPQPSVSGNFVQQTIGTLTSLFGSVKSKLSLLFTQTGSTPLRMIAALVIGVLLSLTPCIFPMIPITVGILQANQTGSAFRNFLIAASYTLGISLTFAILGFVAALGSCVFGELQGSPWVIIPLALVLGYLGFSMLGFYNMYIPRFLQPKGTAVKGGSFLSAFTFGAASGTIASPCLSPGLILILNYVTSLSSSGGLLNYLEGFALLFVFGVGSSLPLLIIGTFSSSINLLPQAGMWMEEVKKLIGLMLLGMTFYHLSHLGNLLPWHILVWLAVITLFGLGIYYFFSITSWDSYATRVYKRIMGTALIVAGCLMSFQGYKAVYDYRHGITAQDTLWSSDYTQALQTARTENKNLFIDIGASYCAACHELDKAVLQNSQVRQALQAYVPVKIEADTDEKAYSEIKKAYGTSIKGFPTLLIVNPKTNQIVKQWSIELQDLSIPEIVKQLESYSK